MENRGFLNRHLQSFIAGVIIVGTVSLSRLLPHPPNVAPITGLALFAGANLGGVTALALPLGSMLVSDLFLGFHATILYVYGSFALITWLGRYLARRWNFPRLMAISLFSSLLFFLVTNFGVWLQTNLYPKNWAGLGECYLMGLPFFRNTILGDLAYTWFFFYGYSAVLAGFKMLGVKFTKLEA